MLVVYPSLIKPPQGLCYCKSSKLFIIQCSNRFLAMFLFCTHGSHRGTVLESPKAFLTHLHIYYKSLIRVCHFAVMLQRSCCSTLLRAASHFPHYSLFLLLSWTGSGVLLWPQSGEQLWHSFKWDQIKCGVWAPSVSMSRGTLLKDQVCKDGVTLIRHVSETDRSWLTSERNSWSWDQASDIWASYMGKGRWWEVHERDQVRAGL